MQTAGYNAIMALAGGLLGIGAGLYASHLVKSIGGTSTPGTDLTAEPISPLPMTGTQQISSLLSEPGIAVEFVDHWNPDDHPSLTLPNEPTVAEQAKAILVTPLEDMGERIKTLGEKTIPELAETAPQAIEAVGKGIEQHPFEAAAAVLEIAEMFEGNAEATQELPTTLDAIIEGATDAMKAQSKSLAYQAADAQVEPPEKDTSKSNESDSVSKELLDQGLDALSKYEKQIKHNPVAAEILKSAQVGMKVTTWTTDASRPEGPESFPASDELEIGAGAAQNFIQSVPDARGNTDSQPQSKSSSEGGDFPDSDA